jgi:hypothetical protein
MQQRDPVQPRSFSNSAIIASILLAAAVVLGVLTFWTTSDTRTGTAMRDDSPRVERPSQSPTPGPTPTKPAQ